MKSAIILGATGLTGSYILNKLLKRNDYSKIIVFSRRELDIVDQKLEVIICDLLNLEEQKKNSKQMKYMFALELPIIKLQIKSYTEQSILESLLLQHNFVEKMG